MSRRIQWSYVAAAAAVILAVTLGWNLLSDRAVPSHARSDAPRTDTRSEKIAVGWLEETRVSLGEGRLSDQQVAVSLFCMLGLVPQMQREGDLYQRDARLNSYLTQGGGLTEQQVVLVEEHARLIAARIRMVSARVRIATAGSSKDKVASRGGEGDGRPITHEEYVHIVAELRESVAAGMVTEEDAEALMSDMRRAMMAGWIDGIPSGLAPFIRVYRGLGPDRREAPEIGEPKALRVTPGQAVT